MNNSDSVRLRFDREFTAHSDYGKMAHLMHQMAEDRGIKVSELMLETLSSRFLPLAIQEENTRTIVATKAVHESEFYIQYILLHCSITDPRSSDSKKQIQATSSSDGMEVDSVDEYEIEDEDLTEDQDKTDFVAVKNRFAF